MKKALLLAMVACLLSGCLTAIIVASNSNGFPVSASSIPQSGIYSVSDVVVESRRNNLYRLVTAGKKPFTHEQLLTVLWCRATTLTKENNFADWKPIALVDHTGDDGLIAAEGLIQLLPTPPGEKTKDWCAAIPPQAKAPRPTTQP